MSTAGVIILGNSGVGKSFLGNVILNQEAFEHRVRANAVTVTTEYKPCQINGKQYAVYNIPGLVEANQKRIDINKREIDRAFKEHPYGVVVYVFGAGDGGRVREEDIIAFNAINDAYPLHKKSLITIVNNIPKIPENEKSEYESDAILLLKEALKMDLEHICCIYQINKTSTSEKQAIQTKLLDKIKIALPKIHKKEHEIHLQAADLSKLRKEMADLVKVIQDERKENEKVRKQMEDQRKQHQLELEKEREFMKFQNLRIRDRSPPPAPTPYYVPVPVIQYGGMASENASRRVDPRCFFDPPRHLRNDGQPDRRYKENT